MTSWLGFMPQITLASEASSAEPANLIVEMLENIGVSTNVAYVLVSLHEGGNLSSRELQSVCGLRQPEISMAMKELLNEEMRGTKRRWSWPPFPSLQPKWWTFHSD